MKKTETMVTAEKGVTMKKGEVLQLNSILSGLKIGKVSKEGAFALLDTKIALTPVVQKIEEARKIAAEELKPEILKKEGIRDALLEKEWNDRFVDYMDRYLSEEISVKLEKLSRADLFELVQENNLELGKIEILNVLV